MFKKQSDNEDIPVWVLSLKQYFSIRPNISQRFKIEDKKRQSLQVKLLQQSVYGFCKRYEIKWFWFCFVINIKCFPINHQICKDISKNRFFTLQQNLYYIQTSKKQNNKIILHYHLQQLANQLILALFLSEYQIFQNSIDLWLIYCQKQHCQGHAIYKICQINNSKILSVKSFLSQFQIKLNEINFFEEKQSITFCLHKICFQRKDVFKHYCFMFQKSMNRNYLINSESCRQFQEKSSSNINISEFIYQHQHFFLTSQLNQNFLNSAKSKIIFQSKCQNSELQQVKRKINLSFQNFQNCQFWKQNYNFTNQNLEIIKYLIDLIASLVLCQKIDKQQTLKLFKPLQIYLLQNQSVQNTNFNNQIKKVMNFLENQKKEEFKKEKQLNLFSLQNQELNCKIELIYNKENVFFYQCVNYQMNILLNGSFKHQIIYVQLFPILVKVYQIFFQQIQPIQKQMKLKNKQIKIKSALSKEVLILWESFLLQIVQLPIFLSYNIILLIIRQMPPIFQVNFVLFQKHQIRKVFSFIAQSINFLYQFSYKFALNNEEQSNRFNEQNQDNFIKEKKLKIVLNLIAISFKFLQIPKVSQIIEFVLQYEKGIQQQAKKQLLVQQLKQLNVEVKQYKKQNLSLQFINQNKKRKFQIKLNQLKFKITILLLRTILAVNCFSFQTKLAFYYENQVIFKELNQVEIQILRLHDQFYMLWLLCLKGFFSILKGQINQFCIDFFHFKDQKLKQFNENHKKQFKNLYQQIEIKIKQKEQKTLIYAKYFHLFIVKFQNNKNSKIQSTNYLQKEKFLLESLSQKNTNEFLYQDLQEFYNLNYINSAILGNRSKYTQLVKYKMLNKYFLNLVVNLPNPLQKKYSQQLKLQIHQHLNNLCTEMKNDNCELTLIAIKSYLQIVSILTYITNQKIKHRIQTLLQQMIDFLCSQKKDEFLFFMQNLENQFTHCLKTKQIKANSLQQLVKIYKAHIFSLRQQINFNEEQFLLNLKCFNQQENLHFSFIELKYKQIKEYYFCKMFLKYICLQNLMLFIKEKNHQQNQSQLFYNIQNILSQIKSQSVELRLKNLIMLKNQNFLPSQKLVFFSNNKEKHSFLHILRQYKQQKSQFLSLLQILIEWIKISPLKTIYQLAWIIYSLIQPSLQKALQQKHKRQQIIPFFKRISSNQQIQFYMDFLHISLYFKLHLKYSQFFKKLNVILFKKTTQLALQNRKQCFKRLIYFQLLLTKNKMSTKYCKLLQNHLKINHKIISLAKSKSLYYHQLHILFLGLKKKTLTSIYQSKCFNCYSEAFCGNIFQSKLYKYIEKYFNNLYSQKYYNKKQTEKIQKFNKYPKKEINKSLQNK